MSGEGAVKLQRDLKQFIQNHHGVESLSQVDPLRGFTPMHRDARNVRVRHTLVVPSNGPTSQAKLRQSGQAFLDASIEEQVPLDKVLPDSTADKSVLSRACVYGLVTQNRGNPWDLPLGVEIVGLTEPSSSAIRYHEDLTRNAGWNPKTSMVVFSSSDQRQAEDNTQEGSLVPFAEKGASSKVWCQHFGGITPRNLKNGVIQVPDVLTQGLNDLAKSHGASNARSWVLIPHGHILAWPLDAQQIVQQFYDLFAFSVRRKSQMARGTEILYWVTSEECLESLQRECTKLVVSGMRRSDLQELHLRVFPWVEGCASIDEPLWGDEQDEGQLELDTRLGIVLFPPDTDNLIPVFTEGFWPKFEDWCPEDAKRPRFKPSF